MLTIQISPQVRGQDKWSRTVTRWYHRVRKKSGEQPKGGMTPSDKNINSDVE